MSILHNYILVLNAIHLHSKCCKIKISDDCCKPVCFSSSFPSTLRRTPSSARSVCPAVLVGLWHASSQRPSVVSASRSASPCCSLTTYRQCLLPWRLPPLSYVEMVPGLIPVSLLDCCCRRTSQTCCGSPTSSDCWFESAFCPPRCQQQQQLLQLSAPVTRQTSISINQFPAERTEIMVMNTTDSIYECFASTFFLFKRLKTMQEQHICLY